MLSAFERRTNMKKEQAIEILNALLMKFPQGLPPRAAAEALAAAGAFTDGAAKSVLACAQCGCREWVETEPVPRVHDSEAGRCELCGSKGNHSPGCSASRPAANGAGEPHPGWVSARTGETVRHSSESRPVANGASEITDGATTGVTLPLVGVERSDRV
jgi:hypothetical protein